MRRCEKVSGCPVVLLICGFAFPCFSYPPSTAVLTYEMEISRNKQLLSFKLHAFLSGGMTSQGI